MVAYWDSCLFLDYFNRSPRGTEIVAPLIADARRRQLVIYTSTLAVTEVAYAAHERERQRLDPQVEDALDHLFRDHTLVLLVDCDLSIALAARDLMRRALLGSRRLKPPDAIHLASAVAIGATEFWSFDETLCRLANDFAIVPAGPPVPPEHDEPRMLLP